MSETDVLISLTHSIDESWLRVPATVLGDVPAGEPTPDLYVLIAADGAAKRRLDVYWPKEASQVAAKAVPWNGKVLLGGGDLVFLVDIETGADAIIGLGSDDRWRPPPYFLDFRPAGDDLLLILSGSGLVCLGPDGVPLWRRDDLALDGVEIMGVTDGVIYGAGQVDPPDGWQPFALDLKIGKSLKL